MINKLSEYCTIISGYAFKASDLSDDDKIAVIKIGNIGNKSNLILSKDTQYVSDKFMELDKKYHVNYGDVLISLTGSHINQPNSIVGRCCVNYNHETYLLNQRAGKVIPKKNANLDYMYYLLSSDFMKCEIVNRAYGAANQVNVSPKDLMKIKYDFPNLTIQEKISSVLKKYDELIENNNKRIKILEQMAEELYKEWFVRFRYPGYRNDSFVGDIPARWKISRIKEIGKIITGKTPSTKNESYYGEYCMFVKTPDMHGNTFVISTSENLSLKGSDSQKNAY